jgi:hypothetical protein
MGIGIGGIAIGSTRPNIYLKDIKLSNPSNDSNFSLTVL